MAYNLKAAIEEGNKRAHIQQPKDVTPKPPKVNPAPNQPSSDTGNLSMDQFENKVNNEAKNPNSHSSNNSANNPNNSSSNDLNYKKNGLNNPNNDKNDINPDLEANHTPFQRVVELAQLIERYSLPTLWQESFPCPCISASGYPRPDCPICHGLGLAFKDPVEIDIAYQRDNRQFYNGRYGLEDTGTTMATPQITENGIENGIGPRDRLSVDGLTVPQTYIFNVNSDRINTGEYIPYHVQSIDLAATMDGKGNSGKLKLLKQGVDYTFNKETSVFTPANQWLNHSITLRMTVSLRFYVTNVLKETRYATIQRLQTKQTIFGKNKPNKLLTNYVRKYHRAMKPGEVYIRMPKYLEIRRENIVLGNEDFNASKKKAKRQQRYTESKVTKTPNTPLNFFGD